MRCKSALKVTSWGFLLLGLSCQTSSPKTTEGPKMASAVSEPKLTEAGRLYFKDPACPRPFSVWQTVVGLSDTADKPLSANSLWTLPGRVIRVQADGAPLVQRVLEREGQFFEEPFTFGAYSQPFRSVRLTTASQPSYRSHLKLSFENKPLAVGEAIALGQLFRTGGNEATKIVLTLPEEQKAADVFEWIQTSAAERRVDHNAPLSITAQGSSLTLEHVGPRGTSSKFAILQLKAPVSMMTVQIVSERKWPSGSPDAIEIAFTEKLCLADGECKGVKAVSSFVPGKGGDTGKDLAPLAQQLNAGQGTLALGQGGVLELEFDGVLLNHESADLSIEAQQKSFGCPNPAQKVRVYAKAKPEHVWQAIDRDKGICFSERLDLQLLHFARFLKIEDISSKHAARGFELSRIQCIETPKLEAPAAPAAVAPKAP